MSQLSSTPLVAESVLLYLEKYPVPPRSVVADKILLHLIGNNRTKCSYKDEIYMTVHQVRSTWSHYDWTNVRSFMSVDKCFQEAGRKAVGELLPRAKYLNVSCPILKLPRELFSMILEYLTHSKAELLDLWRTRASLSVESFASAPPPRQPVRDIDHIGQFRLVCQKFARDGLCSQFLRVETRFSSKGFQSLQELCKWEHAAREVKQFSYMIPRLYSKDRAQFEEILHDFNPPQSSTTVHDEESQAATNLQARIAAHYRKQISEAMTKAEEQRQIVSQGIDRDGLLHALLSFRHLKQIRVMRVVDAVDGGWAIFLKNNPNYTDALTASEWISASEHAMSTLYAAVENSGSPVNRLSSRFIDPSIPMTLTPALSQKINTIARKLVSIELQVVDHSNPDEKFIGLSPVFEALFRSAVGLESFHIGSNHQISVPLVTIFHGLHFKTLKHIGLHLWQLECEELLELLELHQRTLRSLRLRRIILKRTSIADRSWEKVLHFIRLHLDLEWISLRGISYEEESTQMGGMQLSAHPMHLHSYDSESDLEDPNDWSDIDAENDDNYDDSSEGSEDDDMQNLNGAQATSSTEQTNLIHDIVDEEASLADSDGSEPSADEVEYEEEDHHSDLDEIHGDTGESTVSPCQCNNGFGWDDLHDNGVSISRKQWKRWEKWALLRCKTHDHYQSR